MAFRKIAHVDGTSVWERALNVFQHEDYTSGLALADPVAAQAECNTSSVNCDQPTTKSHTTTAMRSGVSTEKWSLEVQSQAHGTCDGRLQITLKGRPGLAS